MMRKQPKLPHLTLPGTLAPQPPILCRLLASLIPIAKVFKKRVVSTQRESGLEEREQQQVVRLALWPFLAQS